jgi:hypothetical protein
MNATLSHPEVDERAAAPTLEERQTKTLCHLYELRLQLLTASLAVSECHWLAAALEVNQAHDLVSAAIQRIEKTNPALT